MQAFRDWFERVNKDGEPMHLICQTGEAILVSKSDWNGLQETIYLQSIPGFVESVREVERSNDWVSKEEFLEALNSTDDSIQA